MPGLWSHHRGCKGQKNTRGTGCAPKHNKPVTDKVAGDWLECFNIGKILYKDFEHSIFPVPII